MTECEARRHINEARRHLPPVSFCTTTSHSLHICSNEHHTAIVLHKSGNDPHPQRKALFTVHLALSKYKLQTDKLRLSRHWSSVFCIFLSVLHFFLPSCSFSQSWLFWPVIDCYLVCKTISVQLCSGLQFALWIEEMTVDKPPGWLPMYRAQYLRLVSRLNHHL